MENKVLLFGPDSVWVNVSYGDRPVLPGEEQRVQPEPRPLDEAIYEELHAQQEVAREQECLLPTFYTFAGAPLLLYPNSGGLTSSWRFILRNDAIELKVGQGKRNGLIGKVRISAEYLWMRRDLAAVLRELHAFLAEEIFGAPVYLSASEIHLCADTTGYDFSASAWQEGFIRRCAFTPHFGDDFTFVKDEEENEEEDAPLLPGPDRLHMRYRRITGFTFGSHKSAVSAVIYNKTNYITTKAKGSTWFYPLWQANGWDGSSEVWREEMRIKRPALKEAGIESAYDLVAAVPGIWQYMTQEWLRYVVPGSDSNRARWSVHPAWSLVQSAYHLVMVPGQVDMGPIIREHKRVANMDQMTAQIVGCFITLHAWRLLGKGVLASPLDADLTDVLCDFYPEAQTYIDERAQKARRRGQSWDFLQEVRYKQRLYHQVADAKAIA